MKPRANVQSFSALPKNLADGVDGPSGLPENTHDDIGGFGRLPKDLSGAVDRRSPLAANTPDNIGGLSALPGNFPDGVDHFSGLPENMPCNVDHSPRLHEDQPWHVGRFFARRGDGIDERNPRVVWGRRTAAMGCQGCPPLNTTLVRRSSKKSSAIAEILEPIRSPN